MSALHKAEITAILSRWLQRYSPPASIRDNELAQQDEAEALLSALLRFAPGTDAGAWARRALDRLDYQMKTRAWPTKAELAKVCSDLRRETDAAALSGDGQDMSDLAIVARRMHAGDTVGEGWLYGVNAVALIASGQIDEATMRAYRSSAFLARRKLYGDEAAQHWEAEAKGRHEAAKQAWRSRNEPAVQREASVPDMRAPSARGQAA